MVFRRGTNALLFACCAWSYLAGCGGLLEAPTERLAPADAGVLTSPPRRPPATSTDDGDDAGAPPHTVQCKSPRAAVPPSAITEPAPAFFVSHPLPQVQNKGGAVLRNPRIVPIFFTGDPLAGDLENFVGSVGCTEYWRTAVSEYGVGDALAAQAVLLDERAPEQISNVDIESWLADKIASNALEAPTADTVYTIFYPETTTITMDGAESCTSFGGYHTNIDLPDGTRVAYAALPRCSGFIDPDTLGGVTGATSHELIEASTDPFNKAAPAFAYMDADHLAFTMVLGAETGDMCAQEPDAFFKPDGYPYVVQRNWSNRLAQAGRSPCTPTSNATFFTAAPNLSDTVQLLGQPTIGVKVPAGTSRTIDVDLFSEDPTEPLALDILAGSSSGASGGTATYTFDRDIGVSGDALKLTIGAPTGADAEVFTLLVSSGGHQRVAWVGAVSQ